MAHPAHSILLIHGNGGDRTAIEYAIEHSPAAAYTCLAAPTAAAAHALCRKRLPGAIVIDDHLPDSEPLAFLAELIDLYGEHAFAIVLLVGASAPSRRCAYLKSASPKRSGPTQPRWRSSAGGMACLWKRTRPISGCWATTARN